ncbi:MAG: hypothetical protein EP335_11850 [Alphaproteobacteria bacterium]|nr:MAG: hypothetical protein EP335_11850 [Alphaproteobacteria bacterium]
MITLATIAMLFLEPPNRVYNPAFDQDCTTTQTNKGHETYCPNYFDYSRAEYVRRLPPMLLPGHTSDGLQALGGDIPALPANCTDAIKTFYEKAARLSYFLQRQKSDIEAETLTREAAYNVEQIVKGYHMQVSREAKAKKSYNTPDNLNGYTGCAAHANAGTKEIYRLGDIIIHELNRENYGLKNTGLNPYSK